MKRIVLLLFIFFYNLSPLLYSQISSDNMNISSKNILQESIYVHANSNVLLTGEKLLYQIYCINNNTHKISEFSKVAYVELRGENNNLIFKHKIRLKSGIGQGDFFIPTTISSGSYKLISYTQWMLNSAIDNFFQGDFIVINPYQKNKISKDTLDEIKKRRNFHNKRINTENNFLQLEINSDSFTKRSEVILNIKKALLNQSFGNYSLSVRRIDSLNFLERMTAINHNFDTTDYTLNYLPELRGELISGNIVSSDLKETVLNKKVALSIPDNDTPIFKIANTNDKGVFYFNLENEYQNSEVLLQIMGYSKKDFTINLHSQPSINYENLAFKEFSINQNLIDFILERSIHIQIENAYNSVKYDSINESKFIDQFYERANVLEYVLDEYTRFPTLKETFIEVIDKAWLIKEKGKHEFRIRGNNDITITPIVLIDGFLIQNHDEIAEFSTKEIEKISLLRDEYIYGSQKFGGIISIKTNNQNYKNNISREYSSTHKLFKSQRNKTYFTPKYTDKYNLSRIPDFRTQLLWLPNIKLDKTEKSISFYTSDIVGSYEIVLEGFSKNGKPTSLKKIIIVE